MEVEQFRWTPESGWEDPPPSAHAAHLVLVFADSAYFREPICYHRLHAMFPAAHIVGCSSSGNVHGTRISDGDIVVTALTFARGRIRTESAEVGCGGELQARARDMMDELSKDTELRHVLVFSGGLSINGSELARGLNHRGIPVTGGLAGDGTRFGETWVMADGPAARNLVAVVGLYGDVSVKSGCVAGWTEFGAERIVTRAHGNVVFEIDHQPALAIYTKYLGEMARELPGSGLRFPLSIRASEHDAAVIRTLLAVDAEAQSLTFAGDVPQGAFCRLMKTTLDALIDGSGAAADIAKPHDARACLCLVISCVGRRLVLGALTEEELDILRERLGPATAIAGFYSYGELAPFRDLMNCQLHNQTMTVTTLSET